MNLKTNLPFNKEIWLKDLGYYVALKIFGYYMEFNVYPCGESISEKDSVPIFETMGSNTYKPTEDIKKATILISGSIKWDGCSNFNHPDELNGLQHFCGLEMHKKYFLVWEKLYNFAAQLIPNADSNMILGH